MDAAAEAAGPKAKGATVKAFRQRALNAILTTPDGPVPKGMYRDPAARARR